MDTTAIVATVIGGLLVAAIIGLWKGVWKRWPWEIRRKPRAIRSNDPPDAEPITATPSWKALNAARERRYRENRGLFLIHTCRSSQVEGQVANVEIRLAQHPGPDEPLASGQVEAVEYTLGPKFSDHSRLSRGARDDFTIEEDLYGPMLCLAKVYFREGHEPILLERYINIGQGHGQPGTDVELREELRRGKAELQTIVEEGVFDYSSRPALTAEQRAFIDDWTGRVVRLLAQRDPADAKEFQDATDERGPVRSRELRDFASRVEKLETLLNHR